MLSARRILVLAPHADDESLGCGGLLRVLSRRPDPPYVRFLLLSNGDVTLDHGGDRVTDVRAETRWEEFGAAAALAGADPGPRYADVKTREMFHNIPDLVWEIEHQANAVQADCLLLPYKSFHSDHRAAYEAAVAALRPHHCRTVRRVFAYETFNYAWAAPGEEFSPNVYIHLDGDAVDFKLKLCGVYLSQRLHDRQSQAAILRHMQRRGSELWPVPPDPDGPPVCAEAFKLLRAWE